MSWYLFNNLPGLRTLYPNHVYRLHKALYGLKQAPKAWYERLRDFLLNKGFKIGMVETTLFTRIINEELFVCQIYVDDIIFGSTNPTLCKEFGEMMAREFEMSMIGELNFFLGFQIKQLKEGLSSIKKSIQRIFSRNSRWMIASRSRLQCQLMDILT